MNIYNEIKNLNEKTNIFIDMDGVISEYGRNDGYQIKNNIFGGYLNKRPLLNNIEIIKQLSELKHVNIYILSLCNFEKQKEEKLLWIKEHFNFINRDNIYIIIKTKENSNKYNLKGEYINKICNKNEIKYLIDDNHQILKATKQIVVKIECVHVSELIQ